MKEQKIQEQRTSEDNIQWIIPPGLKDTAEAIIRYYLRQYRDSGNKNSPTRKPFLIVGETGVGKQFFAELVVALARRDYVGDKEIPIKTFECGRGNTGIMSSELFGYKKGAFSEAKENRKGYIEEADKGVLWLDEIGSLDEDAQKPFLTFLDNKTVQRVGDTEQIPVDVIIVATTNVDVDDPTVFRKDLRHRFTVFRVSPLTERRADILYYLYHTSKELFLMLTRQDILLMLSHNWPGNVRELEEFTGLMQSELWFEERLRDGFGTITLGVFASTNLPQYYNQFLEAMVFYSFLQSAGICMWGFDEELIDSYVSLSDSPTRLAFFKGIKMVYPDERGYMQGIHNIAFCHCEEFDNAWASFERFCKIMGFVVNPFFENKSIILEWEECRIQKYSFDSNWLSSFHSDIVECRIKRKGKKLIADSASSHNTHKTGIERVDDRAPKNNHFTESDEKIIHTNKGIYIDITKYDSYDDFQRDYLSEWYIRCGFNKARTARALGMNERTFTQCSVDIVPNFFLRAARRMLRNMIFHERSRNIMYRP